MKRKALTKQEWKQLVKLLHGAEAKLNEAEEFMADKLGQARVKLLSESYDLSAYSIVSSASQSLEDIMGEVRELFFVPSK